MHDFVVRRTAFIDSAQPGIVAARELSTMTDAAVRELARAAARLEGRWGIIALGGWGAGALLPKSDLDLLVLSDKGGADLKPFVEAVLYPLWDAGLKVGHQVRTPRQQIKALREDLKTRTAALTGRALAGDADWANDLLAQYAADTARHAGGFLAQLRARERAGSPWSLTPDLKDGAGGRRDFDELTWIAAALSGRRQDSPAALVQLGLLGPDEYERVRAAAEQVARGRWIIQRAGYGDMLGVDAAAELEPGLDAESIQRALGDTAVALAAVRERAAERFSRPTRRRSSQTKTHEEPAITAPEDLAPVDLLRMLDSGVSALPALEAAAQSGALDAIIPGFSDLMAIRRPGLGHELTVGAHCLAAAVLAFEDTAEPSLARSVAAVTDRREVQIAALTHDLGKIGGGAGHAERGAEPARAVARACGFSAASCEDVADLVRLHLVLIETAVREDLDDEDSILRCAARIGRRELVAPLHLLAAADSRATGASTWTPWMAALVSSLVARVDSALSPEVDGAGLATAGETARQQALSRTFVDAERAFIAAAPLRYLAGRPLLAISRDAALVAELLDSAPNVGARIAASAGPVDATRTVIVAARNRPRLLACIAGSMALAGLDILSVDAFSAPGGIALDSFVVASDTARPLTEEHILTFERYLDAALRDRLELATRLEERRRHYPARPGRKKTVTSDLSGYDTALRVTAPNRPGLLYDIANAVAAHGVDIRWANVQTVGDVARDTFHVVGEDGEAIADSGLLGHLSMAIRAAL